MYLQFMFCYILRETQEDTTCMPLKLGITTRVILKNPTVFRIQSLNLIGLSSLDIDINQAIY